MRKLAIAALAALFVVTTGCGGSSSSASNSPTGTGVNPATETIYEIARYADAKPGLRTMRKADGKDINDYSGAAKLLETLISVDGVKMGQFETQGNNIVGPGHSGSVSIDKDGRVDFLLREGDYNANDMFDNTHFRGVAAEQVMEEADAYFLSGASPYASTKLPFTLNLFVNADGETFKRAQLWLNKRLSRETSTRKLNLVNTSQNQATAPSTRGGEPEPQLQGSMYAGMWSSRIYFAGHISLPHKGGWLTLGHGVTELPSRMELPVKHFSGYRANDGSYAVGTPYGDFFGKMVASLQLSTIIDARTAPTVNETTTILVVNGEQASAKEFLGRDGGSYTEQLANYVSHDVSATKLYLNKFGMNNPNLVSGTISLVIPFNSGTYREEQEIQGFMGEALTPEKLLGAIRDQISAMTFYALVANENIPIVGDPVLRIDMKVATD